MFRWLKRRRVSQSNIYTVLNSELERMHWFMANRCKANSKAVGQIYDRITEIQDKMLEALDKHPADQEALRDLQETVSELVLLGDGQCDQG